MKHEIIANLHIHTVYSDGAKTHKEIAEIAAESGLDAIFITDHNVSPRGFDGYYTFYEKKVLLITGEEIHDPNRLPQKNHLLAIGANCSLVQFAANPQKLIDEIRACAGLSFIAHSTDPALPPFDEADLSWVDWSVRGFTGMEIWNNLSEFKFRVKNKLQAGFFAICPQFLALQPPEPILGKWDDLLSKGCRVVGIGGSDAHTFIYKIGPFTKEVFPYRYHFQTINTHILMENQLSGVAQLDTPRILESLEGGDVFVANDRVKPSFGFRFGVQLNGELAGMGSRIDYRNDARLVADLPSRAECVLLRNGKVVARKQNCARFEHAIDQRGIYRLECYRRYLFRKRGWIFSNPIYIV